MTRTGSGNHSRCCNAYLEIKQRQPLRACEFLREFDVQGKLGQIHLPTLVVVGLHDTGTSPAATQAIADVIKGAQFELLEAAHLAPAGQSHRFAALLETFLERPV